MSVPLVSFTRGFKFPVSINRIGMGDTCMRPQIFMCKDNNLLMEDIRRALRAIGFTSDCTFSFHMPPLNFIR